MENELFNTFEKNKSGSIDYDEFIHFLIGKMSDFRTQIVEKVFEKLDIEKTGKVPYDAIRESYNVDKHPDILNEKELKKKLWLDLLISLNIISIC